MSDEQIKREFEAWAQAHFVEPNLKRYPLGFPRYREDEIQIAYEAFHAGMQAARAQSEEARHSVTAKMINQAAQRLVRWEPGSVWPDSWSALDVAAARQDAERALRSGLAVAPNPHKEAIDEALAAYARGKPVDEIMRELKSVQRDTV